MKRTLTWITWLSLSAVSPIALAVGLGQASVSSYLDAPLNASLPLLESSDYALEDIRVSVAEPPDFAAAGLEWTPLAASVRAQVQEQQGRRLVRLSSTQPINEPWLELLLTIDYPNGQQTRDVTLLFDPQGYSQSPATPAADVSSAAPPREFNNARSGTSAYVGSGDTLWGVAERIKPGEASVQQMMVALLEANPEVFPSGNINDMRAGQTLRVPGAERVLARAHSDADAAIKAMNEAWRTRSNGSLQAVSLPEIGGADVSEAAIDAALQANESTDSGGALDAGGSEAVESEAVAANADSSEAGGSEASDQVAVEEQTDEPEALTRAELTEQLRLSQATLQQVLEEREQMRAELNALRSEVASLTQALSDALAAQSQPPAPLAANMNETDNSDVMSVIERYQWPLALTAIALLIALLVWLRKRREETWENVPLAEPVIKPTASPSAATQAAPMPTAVPVTYPTQPNDAAGKSHNDSGQPATPQAEPESVTEPRPEPELQAESSASAINANATSPLDTDQWLVDEQKHEALQDDDLHYEKSQAAGLAEQGRQRRSGLHAVHPDSSKSVSLAPPPSPKPVSLMLASLGTGLQPSGSVTSDSVTSVSTPRIEPSLNASDDPGHRFIDYHPPILNSASNSSFSSHDGLRTETPMQPTVEFSSEPYAEPVPVAKQPRRPIEEDWDIEEVAFKPRGLDNSEPSKSSK